MAKTKKEKEIEKKIEIAVEKKVKDFFSEKNINKKLSNSSSLKIFGELVGYGIFLLFLFYIFPRLSFVTESYSFYLSIAFWATTVGTIFKIFKHGTNLNPMARSFAIGEHLATLYSTYMLTVIYPLDFARAGYPQLNSLFYYFLYFIILAIILGIFANFIRIFVPEKKAVA